MPLEIWIPKQAEPAYRCRVCGAEYPEHDQIGYQQHVVKCADEHHDQLEGLRLANRLPGIYGPDTIDHELERWTEKHATEIIEGRKRLS